MATQPGKAISLDGRFEIHADAPLPQFDSPAAKAYSASEGRNQAMRMLALVCDPRMPQRMDFLSQIANFVPAGMMKMLDWGVVDWVPENRHRLVAIMEMPGAERVFPTTNATVRAMDESDLVGIVLSELLPVLRELQLRRLTHRAIRPTNLFFTDNTHKHVVLGEAFTSPPAYDQPDLMETIESAMADPAARGNGRFSDDLYALGATLLMLHLGRNSVADVSSEVLLANKINNGSYAALVGSYRISGPIVEVLRGLLMDDVKERWALTDLDLWMNGKRLTPKQPVLPPRATRPLVFGGEEHLNLRSLSFGFARHWESASPIVRSSNFENWLKRTLGDEERVNALVKAIGPLTSGGGGETGDRVISRTCIVLDPPQPLHYKGLAVHVDGIGPAVALAIHQPMRRQVLSEIIASRLVLTWIAGQAEARPEFVAVQKMFESMPGLLGQSGPGYGFERIVYELNRDMPLVSPKFERFHIVEVNEFAKALEVIAQEPGRSAHPIDRHVAAFLGARAKAVTDQWLRPLVDAEGSMGLALGVVRLLAMLQQTAKAGMMPHLCAWMLELLEPAVKAYNNRRRQKALREELEKAVARGVLADMVKPFDDAAALDRDKKGYAAATTNYARATAQVGNLEREAARRDQTAQQMGEKASAVACGIIASIAISIISIVYLI
jgi:hypothetical protein